MKRFYFLLFIISLFQARSQIWCTPGSIWHYSTISPSSGYTKYTYLYDTLVGTNLCNKIKYESHGSCCAGFTFDYSYYIYTYEQNGIVFKNNGTLNAPQYDTLYNFTGAIGTKWRTNPSSGQACAQSYVEITGSGSMVIQGQILNYKTIFYKNYFYLAPQMTPPQTDIDTLFERIGTRHGMEFITGYNCADATDVGPVGFRCFSDYQINFQSSTVACDFTTRVDELSKKDESLEINNPASGFIYVKIKSQTNKSSKRLILIDQLGNKVIDTQSLENDVSLNINAITNGLYILQVYMGNDLVSKKLVIQN